MKTPEEIAAEMFSKWYSSPEDDTPSLTDAVVDAIRVYGEQCRAVRDAEVKILLAKIKQCHDEERAKCADIVMDLYSGKHGLSPHVFDERAAMERIVAAILAGTADR